MPARTEPQRPSDLRTACLAELRRLEGVDRAETGWGRVGDPPAELVILTIAGRRRELYLREVRTHLSYPLAKGIAAASTKRRARPTLLFAPHVGPDMGQLLRERGLQYVDPAGNCWISLPSYSALVSGRPPARTSRDMRALRAPGLQVIFALLAQPGLVNAPIRDVADAAGVSKSTVANVRRQLEQERLLGRGVRRRVLTDPHALVDRWLSAYGMTLRPRLFLGRYATPHADPHALERAIERELAAPELNTDWAWGGGAAADRLTGHHRGRRTVVHVHDGAADLAERLDAVPSPDGPLELLRVPGPLALRGPIDRVAHPLLIIAELYSMAEERAAEAAQEIRERFVDDELSR